MQIVIIMDFCQNIQIPSFMKDQPSAVYIFVPLSMYCLGFVDCISIQDHLHAYIYSKAKGGKGGNKVTELIKKYLSDKGCQDGAAQFDLSIMMDNCLGQNKYNYVLPLLAHLTMIKYFETI